jgi:ParB family chromosome partitioning protein
MAKKAHLGRGLGTLMAKAQAKGLQPKTAAEAIAAVTQDESLVELPVEFLQRGKYQPRRDMTEEGLDELASSIRTQGVIQPIVVRPLGKDRYEIIAGERRWRAAQRAGLAKVPCIVRDIPDEAAIAMALVENIQREDLNAMEEAVALQRLMQEFDLTHQEVADTVGKSRTTVTNLLRLLNLEPETRTLVERGDLEMGHARALLSLSGQEQVTLARQVVAKGMTVRETERLVRQALQPVSGKNKPEPDANIRHLEQRLAEHLGAPVNVKVRGKGKGELVIRYTSLDELDGILSHLGLSEDA